MATVYQICEAQALAVAEVWFELAEINISNPVLSYVLAGVDTLTFTITGQTAFTDDTIFSHNKQIRLRRIVDGGTPELLFLGRIRHAPRLIDGTSEAYSVIVRGMWDWFENTPMRQSWPEPDLSTVTKPRVILFCNGAGGRQTTGEQIEECIYAARDAGCPVAVPSAGDIDNGWSPPYDEQVNITIANAVAKCLANHPHAAIWFDYSSREPRMYCNTRQSLSAVAVDIEGRQAISITPRYDLQPPAIAICYEKEFSDDGRTGVITTIDHAPVIPAETAIETNARLSQVDVVWGVFDLQGFSRQTISQEIEVEELEDAPATIAWWKEKRPWLADYADTDITLSNAQRCGTQYLPAILTKGALQKWMSKDFEHERFTVDALLTDRDSGGGIIGKRRETLSISLPMTDATNKTYKKTMSIDSGESIPSGIAASMWAEWQQLHYEGQISFLEDEPSFNINTGKTINLNGGRVEWMTMQAMIKRAVISIDDGTTTVEFGVPDWLDLDSRVAWYRNCRTRRYAMSRSFRDDSNDGDGGISETNTLRDGETRNVIIRQRQFDPDATTKHEIDLDAAAFAFETSSHGETVRIIAPRERVIAYDDNGEIKAKRAQVLCSEGYGDSVNIGGTRPADPSSPSVRGSNTETDLGSSSAFNPLNPGTGVDGLDLWVSLGSYYDHTADTPVLKEYRVKLRFPLAICPTVSAASTVTIDTPEEE